MQIKNTFINLEEPQMGPKRNHSCPPRFAESIRPAVFSPSASSAPSAEQDQVPRSPAWLPIKELTPRSATEVDTNPGSTSGSLTGGEESEEEPQAHFQSRLASIGCLGCGCSVPILCPHALKGQCNKKSKCKFCHCQVHSHRATAASSSNAHSTMGSNQYAPGAGAGSVKQSFRQYIERLTNGELSGRQYLTFFRHVLGELANAPTWLQDEAEVQTMAQCLVYAFAQKCKVKPSRVFLLKVCRWITEVAHEDSMEPSVVRIVEQMAATIKNMPISHWGWQKDSAELEALKAETLQDKQNSHFNTQNWPNRAQEHGLSSAPWFAVFSQLMKSFAWELFFHSPQSPVFQMNNILGLVAADVKRFILGRLTHSPLQRASLACLPRQHYVGTILEEARCMQPQNLRSAGSGSAGGHYTFFPYIGRQPQVAQQQIASSRFARW